MVFALLAPIAQHAYRAGMLGVICGDNASLSICTKVLTWIEAKACQISHATNPPPFVLSSMCLRGVFDDHQTITMGYFENRVHIGGLAIKMYRYNRFRAFCDRLLDLVHIHVVRAHINVDKNWPRTCI